MNIRRKWRFLVPAAVGGMVWALAAGLPAAHAAGHASRASQAATGALVSVGSPTNIAVRNAQNEPAVAVDPTAPNILAAGAKHLVDTQPCSEQAATTAGTCYF